MRSDVQVLICPGCQRAHDLELDGCSSCGSTSLVCRLGEVECRSCGHVRSAGEGGPPYDFRRPSVPADLAAEVEAALSRVLGRS
ncbi:hypothetical protein [Herbidospora yilanensis]|uniref:hypothetical protein n=1 Tax=Herbidospora yilanensis TaxID=354426 RepID=UPI001E2CD323|nr:hypothetical protein [Herbidospora yilanensis]